MGNRKLDKREARFVEEYLIDLDPQRAAIEAGYSKSVSISRAYEWVSNNQKKPHVFEAIKKAILKRSQRTEISQDRVLQEYAKLAFLDPSKFYDDKGLLIPIHELPKDVSACIAGMDIVTERTGKDEEGKPEFSTVRKIKLVDKKGALDSVARHLGMFNDKLNLSGSLEQRVRAMSKEEIEAELAALRKKRDQ